MGERGPVPRRSAERRRRNKPETPVESVPAVGVVAMPAASELWDPLARDWYLSLAESGQAKFFEPSDWQAARYLAEVMTRNLASGRFSAQLFLGVWSAMGDLLTTEAARRRVRMEIDRGKPAGPAGVTVLDEYRDAFGG